MINYLPNYKNFMMVNIILYIKNVVNSFCYDLDVVKRADEEKPGDLTKRTDGKVTDFKSGLIVLLFLS